MKDLMKIEIASVPDREKLVAELWYGEEIAVPLPKELADELKLRNRLTDEESEKRGPLNLEGIPPSPSAQWAEINQDGKELKIEIYPNPEGGPWVFTLQDAIKALNEAREKLLEE